MSTPRSRAGALALVLAGIASPAAAGSPVGETRPPFLASCPTTRLDAGDPAYRPLLEDGFDDDGRDAHGRTFAAARAQCSVGLYLADGEAETVTVVARGLLAGLTVAATWNGIELGGRSLPMAWTELRFPLLPGSSRPGHNQLDLSGSGEAAAGGDQHRAFLLDRVELAAPGDPCAGSPPRFASKARRFPVGPGAVFHFPLTLTSRTQVRLRFEGDPGATADVYLLEHEGPPAPRLSWLKVTADGTGSADLAVNRCCDPQGALVLVGRGPGTLYLRRIEATHESSLFAWRKLCRQVTPWAIVLAASALLALGLALRLSRFPGGRQAPWLDLVLVIALALAARAGYFHLYPQVDARRGGDGWEYLHRARLLATGEASFLGEARWHAWSTWIRPPGYYLFLAAIHRLGGWSVRTIAEVQAVLGALTAGATYLLAWWLFGRGPALAGGLLYALYPEAIVSVSWILSEPLFVFLLSCGLALLARVATAEVPSWPVALAAGAFLGLAALVRSAPIYFVPAAALLLVIVRGRRGLRPALALACGLLLFVVPCSVRNSLLVGRFMLIDDIGVANFLQANPDPRFVKTSDLDPATYEGFRKLYQRIKLANRDGRVTAAGGLMSGTLLRMAREPGPTLRRFGENLRRFYSTFAEDYPPAYIGERRPCRVALVTDVLNLGYLTVALLGAAGFLLALRERRAWPVLVWVPFLSVIVNLLFFWDMPGRFRLPLIPVLAACAGLAVARGAGALRRAWTGRRRPA